MGDNRIIGTYHSCLWLYKHQVFLKFYWFKSFQQNLSRLYSFVDSTDLRGAENVLKIRYRVSKTSTRRFLFILFSDGNIFSKGFKNLNPKLTVVKKQPDKMDQNPDDFLPSVMT